MMGRLKQRIGKRLIRIGIGLHGGEPEAEKTAYSTEVKQVLGQPLDASVEVEEAPQQWQPEQSGNVIIAEPELMHQYRRGKL
jgi:hypothetical protein